MAALQRILRRATDSLRRRGVMGPAESIRLTPAGVVETGRGRTWRPIGGVQLAGSSPRLVRLEVFDRSARRAGFQGSGCTGPMPGAMRCLGDSVQARFNRHRGTDEEPVTWDPRTQALRNESRRSLILVGVKQGDRGQWEYMLGPTVPASPSRAGSTSTGSPGSGPARPGVL